MLLHVPQLLLCGDATAIFSFHSFGFLAHSLGSSSIGFTSTALFLFTLSTLCFSSSQKVLLGLFTSRFFRFTLKLFLRLEFILVDDEIDATRIFRSASQTFLGIENQIRLVLFLLTTCFFFLFSRFFSSKFFFMTLIFGTTLILFGTKSVFSFSCSSSGIVVSTSTRIFGFSFAAFSILSGLSLRLDTSAPLIFISNFALFSLFEDLDFFKSRFVVGLSSGDASHLFSVDSSDLLSILLPSVFFRILKTNTKLLELFKGSTLSGEIIVLCLSPIAFCLCSGSHRSLRVRGANFFSLKRSFDVLLSAISVIFGSDASIFCIAFELDNRFPESVDGSFGFAAALILVVATLCLVILHL